MARTGRPTKLTPELSAKVCGIIRAGNYRDVAAKRSGLPMRTFSDWLKKGRKEKSGAHRNFLLAVIEAEAVAETAMVAVVRRGAKKDPKCAQWFLERKFPERWGRRDKTIISQASVAPVTVGGDATIGGLVGDRNRKA